MNKIVANQIPSKNTNVWVSFIQSDNSSYPYCKSPFTVMKCMYFLNALFTNRLISDNCVQRLSQEISIQRRALVDAIHQKAKEIADI